MRRFRCCGRFAAAHPHGLLAVWHFNDIAMQVVGVGFIIGVIQDSVETALNSAGDVEFAATAEYHQWLKESKPLPAFMGGK